MTAVDTEVVVVGGGICGLSAAWRLRDRDVLLLEAGDRVGGRILSHERGPYWLNLGAHLLPGVGSTVDRLVQDTGLRAIPVTGTLRGLAVNGKVADSDKPHHYPLTLPLSLRDRISFARAGMRLQKGVKQYLAHGPKLSATPEDEPRVANTGFLDDRTFADFLGPMTPGADAIFRCAVNRGPGSPETVSAQSGLGLFAHVWGGRHTITARNLVGGTGRLPAAIAAELGARIRLSTTVAAIRLVDGGAVVATGAGDEIACRQVVLAVPSPPLLGIDLPLPDDLREALSRIRYRAFLSMAILTAEDGPTPWDHVYSIATPGRHFDMLFNHAQPLRTGERLPGGSLMVYAGADGADRIEGMTDEEIRAAFLDDLGSVYPDAPGLVRETILQRWPLGNTNALPGRAPIQDGLERNLTIGGRLQLAGDFITPIGTMETAASTGALAAARALRRLDG
jgi:oxygen-dependent protoporphyrinogen oxidase